MKKCLITTFLILSLFMITGCGKKSVKVVNEKVDKYIAYIKINPSIKLDYSRKCTEYSDKTIKCDEPIVEEYELVNEDAKEMFKDVDLLSEDKNLYNVINNICNKAREKGVEIKDIEIKSDWNEINTYLTEKQNKKKENQTNSETTNTEIENNKTNTIEENNINFNIDIQEEQNISTQIANEKEEEQKRIAEEEAKKKAEEEARIKAEKEAKKKAEEQAAVTIKLSDNVTYSMSEQRYECTNCFSTSLINTFKNAKGYYVKNSSASQIVFRRITNLSSPYNNTKY